MVREGGAAPGWGCRARAAGPCAVNITEALVTPGMARTTASAAARAGSSARASSALGASITKRTAPSATASARTRPLCARSPPPGSATRDRFAITSSLVGPIRYTPVAERP